MVHQVARSGLDVFAHNVETVERCTPMVRDRRAGFQQSLTVLEEAKKGAEAAGKEILTKSSIMLGVGEQEDEIVETLRRESFYGGFADSDRSTTIRCRRRHLWPIHETDERAHESGPLCPARGVCTLEDGRRGDGLLVRGEWATRQIELQSKRSCHCGADALQAGEFFIENVLKKRRAASAQKAAGQLAAAGDAADVGPARI